MASASAAAPANPTERHTCTPTTSMLRSATYSSTSSAPS
eukprot:CAMPEP_0206258904 /NCGR_PEP_ID=MMETSP0047_2-20121206/26185_1 /ASSEMBLY_ACC=CAM_ASM_000192 /TAXON_ID=195065 /ORGANISM="Chroomonas mesostigmatica_cf, Strain CCMP1168" /LENGTH=38 /DNA_ID= /DNA_START= /DNA_END= /DNA_ORIENTATION=